MLKSSFCLISFENISVLDSYLIYRYIIMKLEVVRFRVKSTNYYGLWPFFSFEIWFLCNIFEKITVLDSYFIHRYIIIKYRSSLV